MTAAPPPGQDPRHHRTAPAPSPESGAPQNHTGRAPSPDSGGPPGRTGRPPSSEGGTPRSPATPAPPPDPGAPEDRTGRPPSPVPPPAAGDPATPEGPPAGVDLARVALRAAKEQARARGAAAQQKRQARRGGLRSGAGSDGRDPVSLGAAISRLIVERGWQAPAAVGGVMGRWPQLVGADLARHCEPQSYDEEQKVLTVRCDSTAWATQLRLLAPQLVARLNADLGHGTVRLIRVLGPSGPQRSYGRLRAPGSRGPGDTYG